MIIMETELLLAILGLYASIFTLWYKIGKLEVKVKVLNELIHKIISDKYGKRAMEK
jgi:hypothetical protein